MNKIYRGTSQVNTLEREIFLLRGSPLAMDEPLDKYLEENRDRFLEQLVELVSIPSVSTDPAYRPAIRRAAEWVEAWCRRIGLESRVLETPGHPCVLARGPEVPGKPTILIYGHYDVQPAEDPERWRHPPFEPVIADGRICGRGACDNKGQLMVHLCALEALQATSGLPLNVIVLVEGEEETGSPNLPALLEEHRHELACQVAVVSDTSTAVKGIPTVHYSLRGIVFLEIEIQVSSRDVHSGIYGGTLANAIQVLAKMCSKLHDEHFRVTVPGFYEGVLEIQDWERRLLQELPFDEEEYARWLGVPELVGEAGFTTNERRWFRPTIEFNGFSGGYTGNGSKTIVPSQAVLKLSARLVPDQDPDHVLGCLQRWFEAECPSFARLEIRVGDRGYPYLLRREGSGGRYFEAAVIAVQEGFGRAPLFSRHGGTVPIVSTFRTALGVDTLLLGLGSPDDGVHSQNEKFELVNFYRGIRTAAALLRELA
ncbi:MAG: M20/M25/M40 family metallo-hydrolase [Armatimonadetes bacterium]|nr:M20/M25/M40 family metallo-hydrolase [Armatimonadota bacterium]